MKKIIWLLVVLVLLVSATSVFASGIGNILPAIQKMGDGSLYLDLSGVGANYQDQFIGNVNDMSYLLVVKADSDPFIDLSFIVTNGAAVPANFHLTVFMSITNAIYDGYANAGVSISDKNKNGATATSGWNNGKLYRAAYNGNTTFAFLCNDLNANPMGADSSNGETGLQYIGNVGSIQSEIWFNLSSKDTVTGTSMYEVTPVPEPSTLVGLLAACGSMFGFAIRKRK